VNILELQKHLDVQWQKLINKTISDKDYDKDGGITHAYDIFNFITNPNKMLGVEIIHQENKILDQKLPQAKNWKIKVSHKKIVMELKKEEYKEIFITIINKIISKIFLEKETGHSALLSFLKNLDEHKNFFEEEGGPRVLSSEAQTGLFGEIYFLSEVLSRELNVTEANHCWTGPYKKYDFSTLKILLETKTSKLKLKKIINTTSDQINPNQDKPLYLIFLNIDESNNEKNLNYIISEYGKKLKEQADEAYNNFCLKLLKVGYHEIHTQHYKQAYEVKKELYYFINKDFPHISDIAKPDAIEDLKLLYKINLDKCDEFLINKKDFLNKI